MFLFPTREAGHGGGFIGGVGDGDEGVFGCAFGGFAEWAGWKFRSLNGSGFQPSERSLRRDPGVAPGWYRARTGAESLAKMKMWLSLDLLSGKKMRLTLGLLLRMEEGWPLFERSFFAGFGSVF